MSNETAQLVKRLRSRLRRALRRMTWAELAFGGAVAAGSLTTFWLVAAALEATFWLPPGLRTGLLVMGGTVLLGVGAAYLARPLGHLLGLVDGPSDEDMARAVGQHHPAVADRLVNLLQLAEGQRSHAPAPYVDRAVQHLAGQIDEVKFDDVADFEPARTAARWATLPLLAALALLVAAPSTFLNASERLLAPRTEFDRPAPFQFTVTPGDTRLVKGDSLRITIRATGTAPETATLLLRNSDDESAQRIALQADSSATFRHTVPNVRRPLRYRIAASPVRTKWFAVDIANRPFLRKLQVRVTPPTYTDRPTRELAPNVGDINALPGSRIRIVAALGGAPVANASIDFENASSQPLTVSADSATGAFTLRREDTYVLRLQSKNEIPNRDPIRYELSLQADARPSVSFLKPDSPAELTPALTQDLRLRLSDDYGIRRVALFYRKINGSSSDSSFSSFELSPSQPRQADQVLSHTWLLAQESGLTLERGDKVAYYVKAWDNDTVNGPKSGRTVTQRLRFPSLSEQYEEFNKLQQQTGEQMQKLNRKSKSLQQQFQKLREELRRTREADWEDRRKLERMQQQQKSLRKGKQKLSRQVDSLNRAMQRKDLSSPKTTKQFRELKKRINEMKSSKELQKALQKLRKSMQSRSFRKMQKNMQTAKSRLQQQQSRLQRMLNLFKQLQARQKMEELTRRAQNITEREKEISKKTAERMNPSPDSTRRRKTSSPSADSTTADSARTSPSPPSDSTTALRSDSTASPRSDSAASSRSDSTRTARSDSTTASPSDSLSAQQTPSPDSSANEDLAREQKELAKKMKKLMKSMKKANQKMKDVPSAPRKKLQKLRKQMQQQNLPRKMRQNSRKLRKNRLQKARTQQQKLQRRLQNMRSRLSKMKKQMRGRQRQMNLTGLRSALENTLRLSKSQESLRQTVEKLSGKGPTVRRYAVQQQDLREGLKHVADSLNAIASRLPRMSQAVQKQTGDALRAMEKATTSLDEREAKRATGFQKTSMKHLNELALLLSSLLDRMQQQGGGGGRKMSMQQAMQKLQKASGRQQKLNQQIQKFLNQVQGKRLSKNMKKRRKQLARQQRKIKQQLEEMNISKETKQKLLGDLQKIAKQMEKSAQDLNSGRHSRDLIERQQQILTRLLNAQQSLRTQGKKQKRRGQRADENVERERPGERPPSDDAATLRRDLIRALEMGYNSDYEALIKRYFELLQERRKEEPQK
ncbi:MAG: DUF4175 family protein [Salinibacter sp.]